VHKSADQQDWAEVLTARAINIQWRYLLSLRFNGHFPGEPGLANTRISPFWVLLEMRVMGVVLTT